MLYNAIKIETGFGNVPCVCFTPISPTNIPFLKFVNIFYVITVVRKKNVFLNFKHQENKTLKVEYSGIVEPANTRAFCLHLVICSKTVFLRISEHLPFR